MKTKFKFILGVLAFAIAVTTAPQVVAEEVTKEYNESWPAAGVETLNIINKFGDIKISDRGGSELTIDVVITVDAPNEAKANELLELINVEFRKSGGLVKAETKIENDFKSRRKFSIDYEVNIPADKNLRITNKYGNTVVGDLYGSGEFNIGYGNLTANELDAPESGNMDLELSYGKADISAAGDLNLEVKYSTINIGLIDDLVLESKYTVFSIDQANSVVIDSKYDTFNFDEVGTVNGDSKYTHYKIGELARSLKIEAGYGGIRVEDVNPDFESINVTNSYGHVVINLGNASYLLDATCNYCGVDYPDDKFAGDRRSDGQTRIVKGKVGTKTGGSVVVTSRYGEIKLRD